MNLQAQKINIIQSLLQLNDKKILSQIEAFLNSKLETTNVTKKVFTKKELISRARKSNKNIAAGKVILQSNLEKASEMW